MVSSITLPSIGSPKMVAKFKWHVAEQVGLRWRNILSNKKFKEVTKT
jgi:hypothetical protein